MIKCIAVDDEPLALEQLTGYIARVPFLQLIASCQDAFSAMQLSEEEVDLMFVDIHMPDLNGLDLVRSLVVKPLIVFTTAYPEYAVEGFKVDAVDYLLKPFEFQDLLKAADKARRQFEYHLQDNGGGTETDLLEKDGSLFVKSEYKIIRINVADICYIEGMSEYVRIYTDTADKPVVTLLSMRKLEERLPQEMFMRVHRSYIVNLRKITEVSRLRIIFNKNIYIPVGDNYKERFTEYINKICVSS
jgi:DNA-binding LytR/AlgR family response regulator